MLPYVGRALSNLFRKPATESFPKTPAPDPQPDYRGRLAYDATKCVNCGMCQRVCAPQAISRKIVPLANGDQQITLTFDMASCTYCGTCAEFCAKKCITLTPDYMIVGTKPEDFLVEGTFIKKKPPTPKFTPEQLEAIRKAQAAKKAAAAAAAGGAASPASAAPVTAAVPKPAAPAANPATAAATAAPAPAANPAPAAETKAPDKKPE